MENLLIESVVRSLKTITESPTSKEHYRMLYTYVQDNMKDFVNTVEQVSDATPGHGEGELNPKYMALEEDGILFIRAPQLKTLLGEGFRQTLREWERLEILLDTSQDGKRRAVKKSTQCGRQEFYVIVMDARFLVGGDSNA